MPAKPANIQQLRKAETVATALRQRWSDLKAEALADDGVVDDDEQAGLDNVQDKIDAVQGRIDKLKAIWEANKAKYLALRPKIDTGLAGVRGADPGSLSEDWAADQKAIQGDVPPLDKAAGGEDYAAALTLGQALLERIERFLDLLAKKKRNAELENLDADDLIGISLTAPDHDRVFTEEYMEKLRDTPIPGEDDPGLKTVMRKLQEKLSKEDLKFWITELANIVGIPPSAEELEVDHGRYLILKKQQEGVQKKKGKEEVQTELEKFPEFMGSRGQLIFGKVLGDAFDIHEVFAALLSPTGGLVGPGEDLIPGMVDALHLDPDNPVAMHGCVHDAAGYMLSYHDEGPGYNYRDDEFDAAMEKLFRAIPVFQDITIPLVGQVSGIAYWTENPIDDLLVEYLKQKYADDIEALAYGIDGAVVLGKAALAELEEMRDALETALDAARDEAAEMIAEALAALERKKDELAAAAEEMADKAAEFVDDVKEAADEFIEDVKDTAEELVDEAREFAEGVKDKAGEVVDDVTEAAEEFIEDVSDTLEDVADAVGEGVKDVAEAVGDAVDSFKDGATEAMDDAYEMASAVGKAAKEKLGALASFIWG